MHATDPTPPEDDAAIPIASVRRFCSRCGAVLIESSPCICELPVARAVVDGLGLERPLRASILLYGALLLVSLITVAVAIATEWTGPGVELTATGAMTLIVLVVLVRRWQDVRPLFVESGGGRALLAGAGLGCATFAVAWAVVTGINTLIGVPGERYSAEYADMRFGWAILFISLVVQPALIEEFAFRGLILRWLQNVLRPGEAVLVTAGLFMMLHLSPMMFAHTFVMGIFAGVLTLRTRSIWPAVALHAVHNGLVLLEEFVTAA